MCSIIACHFCQYYGSEWAWWLNVGVQVFFIISGFLYGNKEIAEPISWLKNQFKKILIPYYIFLFFAIVGYAIVAPEYIGIKDVITSVFTFGHIKGIGHLWFVSYILFCYLITPYLEMLRDYLKDNSLSKTIASLVLIFGVLAIIEIFTNGYYRPGRVDCYILGYYTSVLIKRYGSTVMKWSFFISIIPCFLSNLVFCYLHYVKGIEMKGMLEHITDYSHMFLGYTLTLLLMMQLSKVTYSKVLRFSDSYSYEIYLVHQLFILSPLTLLTVTLLPVLNISTTVLVILSTGISLKYLNRLVQKNSLRTLLQTIIL